MNNENKANETNENENKEIIIGRNAVNEALKAGREINSLFVTSSELAGSVGKIAAQCREKGIPVKQVDTKKLDYMCSGANHQGVIAFAAAHEYAVLDDIFERAKEKNERPFIVICDEIEDPHNLGAIIRTAEAAGAHGIIIPKRRNAPLTFAVSKTSAGAIEYMPVVRVPNLVSTIEELKKRGVWIYGTDMQGETWCQTDLKGSIAIVIGSEGKGIGRLIKENCDYILSIPMNGNVNSLNASVATGVILFEAARQRHAISAI